MGSGAAGKGVGPEGNESTVEGGGREGERGEGERGRGEGRRGGRGEEDGEVCVKAPLLTFDLSLD